MSAIFTIRMSEMFDKNRLNRLEINLKRLKEIGIEVNYTMLPPFMTYTIELPFKYLSYGKLYVKYSRSKEHEEVVLLLKRLGVVKTLNNSYVFNRSLYKMDRAKSRLLEIV